MERFFEHAAEIIEASAKSVLGIVALLILVVAVLAFPFFNQASEPIRTKIFFLTIAFVAFLVFSLVGVLKQPPNPPPNHSPQAQLYCCDLGGNRRCPMAVWLPLNSSCFCPYQGTGFVCS